MKTELEKCIINTNKVIDRWKSNPHCKIYEKEVEAVFLGWLNKYINPSRRSIFKEIKRGLFITINPVTFYIDSIKVNIIVMYLNPTSERYLKDIRTAVESIDFIKLQDNSELEIQEEINFSSITNIKF